jgi:hypothetical protein
MPPALHNTLYFKVHPHFALTGTLGFAKEEWAPVNMTPLGCFFFFARPRNKSDIFETVISDNYL